MNDKKIITDAYQWSYDRYIKGDPELEKFAKEMRIKAEIAQQIYDIRIKLRMTEEDLAEFSGLTLKDIEDIDASNYDGDWNEAIAKINLAFQNWVRNVILPAIRTPEDYSVKAVNA